MSSSETEEGGFIRPSPSEKSPKPKRRRRVVAINSDSESNSTSESDSEFVASPSSTESPIEEIDLTKTEENSSDAEIKDSSPNKMEEEPQEEVQEGPQEEPKEEPEPPAERPRRRQRKPKKEKDPTPNVVKRFNAMEDGLRKNHTELRSVFEDLENEPPHKFEQMAQPPGLKCNLLPFQKEGLHWLVEQEKSKYHGGILADEMGMGKTIQTIALFLSDELPRSGPILVVAPTVAVMQWRNEIEEFAGDALKILVYHGSNRTESTDEIREYDVVLTTYAVVESVYRRQSSGFTRKGEKVRLPSPLHTIHFHRVILDEAHNIKDRQAGTSRAVFLLDSSYRLCLSGTPLQNRIGELYSLLRFLRIDPFCQYFCTKCSCTSHEWRVERQKCLFCGHVAMQHVNYFNHSLLKHIQRIQGETDFAMRRMRLLLRQIMLRRTKMERADDLGLPPRVVTVRRDYFNQEEKDLYTSIFSDSRRQFSTYVNQGVVLNNYANIFSLITRMRQIADHPDLVLRRAIASSELDESLVCKLCDDEAEEPIKSKCNHTFCRMCIKEYVEGWDGSPEDLECPVCHIILTIDLTAPSVEINSSDKNRGSIVNRITMDNTWRSSTKIEALVEELFRMRSDRQTIKSIVFSQFTSMLDLVEWRLARAGFSTVKLQGSMSPIQRDSIIRHFMETPSVEVFLVSLKAGGVALNLCEASQVFLLDPWWNPSVEWQSGDRVHRIGQHRPVTITRLIIEDSIESRIIELQAKKANMINATIGMDDSALNRLSQGDMEFLFQN